MLLLLVFTLSSCKERSDPETNPDPAATMPIAADGIHANDDATDVRALYASGKFERLMPGTWGETWPEEQVEEWRDFWFDRIAQVEYFDIGNDIGHVLGVASFSSRDNEASFYLETFGGADIFVVEPHTFRPLHLSLINHPNGTQMVDVRPMKDSGTGISCQYFVWLDYRNNEWNRAIQVPLVERFGESQDGPPRSIHTVVMNMVDVNSDGLLDVEVLQLKILYSSDGKDVLSTQERETTILTYGAEVWSDSWCVDPVKGREGQDNLR